MAAYVVGHMPSGFCPGVNGGSEAILDCFIFFPIVFAGARGSIDARRAAQPGRRWTRWVTAPASE